MHELSIALSILDLAAEESERRGVDISAIHLRLGPLSGVDERALDSAFELAREHSNTPTARLVIELVPLIVHCPQCNCSRKPLSIQHLVCPVCGSPTPEILSGRELQVFALEVIDERSQNSSRGSSPECAQAQ